MRYGILASEAVRNNKKDPKVAAGAILGKLVTDSQLTDEQFRVGHTKIFFKAGVMASLEDFRDTKMNELITALQCHCRSFFGIVRFDLLLISLPTFSWNTESGSSARTPTECKLGYLVGRRNNDFSIQRAIRFWMMIRTCEW